MAKKHKKNIQELLKKKQLLQNVGQTQPSTITASFSTPTVTPVTANPNPTIAPLKNQPADTVPTTTGREIRWTVISLIFILALLGGIIILDRKTPFLSELGNWLYLKLQLKG